MIYRQGILCLTVLAAAACVAAELPNALLNTPQGPRIQAFFAAYNSGDEAKLQTFITDNYAAAALKERPLDDRLAAMRQMHARAGKMTLHSVTYQQPDHVAVLVQNEHGDWNDVGFLFENDAPHKLMGIRLGPADPPANGSKPSALSEAAALDSARALFDARAKADVFSGAVLIAKDGQPIYQQAYGWANREFNVPNRLDTKFNLGSINKTFTQMAIRQLAAQGKLALGDTLGKFLADYPNAQARAKVTIQQLLDHTSGIGDFFGERYLNLPKEKLRSIGDFLPLFADQPLLFEPGSDNRYSNGGYVVLGAIIEKLSGQTYYDYVREHIFQPAGMTNTDSYELDQVVLNEATGYTHRTGIGETPELRRNTYTLAARGNSAGGGYSTVEDLLKFVNAVEQGKIAGSRPEAMGIAGGSPGVNGAVETSIANHYTIIVLGNLDPPCAEDAVRLIRGWFRRVIS
jgi:CubicO group peptidase (beta-lactamase class C family)